MLARSWITSICTAIGVAVGAGAAQLGIGYGLSIIAWVPSTDDASRAVWLASLAWVAWLSANSTILGALCADWLGRRGSEEDERSPGMTVVWRVVIALAAAIGATITVPLVAVPARFAQQANNSAPQFTAGGYAVVGVIIGLIVAIGALNVPAIAANVLTSAAWLWSLAIVAVANGLHAGVGAGTAQLATWQFTEARWLRGMVNLPSALLMLGAAMLIGVVAAWPAGRRGDHRVGVAVSGGIGPLLIAVAYFLSVPGPEGRDQQLSAYVTAPYAVLAGLAGSVLISALGARGARQRARTDKEAEEAAEYEEWQRAMAESGEPTAGKPKRATATRRTKSTGTTRTKRATAAGSTTAAGSDADADQAGAATASPTSAAAKSTTASTSTGSGSGTASGGGSTDGGQDKSGGQEKTAGQDSAARRRRTQDDDLEDDAYAPSRAYVTDTVEDDSPPAATGRASVSQPLWPPQARQSSKRRKGR